MKNTLKQFILLLLSIGYVALSATIIALFVEFLASGYSNG